MKRLLRQVLLQWARLSPVIKSPLRWTLGLMVGVFWIGFGTEIDYLQPYQANLREWWIFWPCFLALPAVALLRLADERAGKIAGMRGEISQDEEYELLNSIDGIVGDKCTRFAEHARQLAQGAIVSDEQTFRTITRPDIQYQAIADRLWIFLQSTRNDVSMSFHVVLAKMGQRHLECVLAFSPRDHVPSAKTNPDLFRHPDSGFSRARKSGTTIIVPDMAKECRKKPAQRNCRPTPEREEQSGSLICYPIRCDCDGKIHMVLSVYASSRRFFTERDRVLWVNLLNRFAKRLTLERNLDIILSSSCSKAGLVMGASTQTGDGIDA